MNYFRDESLCVIDELFNIKFYFKQTKTEDQVIKRFSPIKVLSLLLLKKKLETKMLSTDFVSKT